MSTGEAYSKEHWTEIMAELHEATEKATRRGDQSSSIAVRLMERKIATMGLLWETETLLVPANHIFKRLL